MKRAFSIAELMIVVAVLGILAAIVVPQFTSQSARSRTAAAKTNLNALRGAIELYAAKNSGVPPGYPSNDISQTPTHQTFSTQICGAGLYLSAMPENPYNGKTECKVLGNSASFPSAAGDTDQYGWIYQPATRTIRLNWTGVDIESTAYFDY